MRNFSSPHSSLYSQQTRPQVCKHYYKELCMLTYTVTKYIQLLTYIPQTLEQTDCKQMLVPLKSDYVFKRQK